MLPMLSGKKTFIISIIGGALGLAEILGFVDFPFIDDPMTQVQIALSAITLRLGIGQSQEA